MEREEILRKLRELAQELGKKTLTQRDIRESPLSMYWVKKHFENLTTALEAAGLQPSKLAKSMATSNDELLDYLDDLQRRLGRRPKIADIDHDGKFSQRIFYARFGSPGDALSQLKERQVSVERHPDLQPPPLTNKIVEAVQEYERDWQQRLQDVGKLTEEKQKLQAELAALQAPERRIIDEELRNDCAELLENRKYYIDAIRRASVVLEERLRKAVEGTGAEKLQYGASLVRHALAKDTGKLVISDHPNEQDGVYQLFSGAFAFVRNPPAHKKVRYTEVEAWQTISLIDYLLLLLRQAKPRE